MNDFDLAKRMERQQSQHRGWWEFASIGLLTALLLLMQIRAWPFWATALVLIVGFGALMWATYRRGVRVATRQPVDADSPMSRTSIVLLVVWFLVYSFVGNLMRDTLAGQGTGIQVLACTGVGIITGLVFWQMRREQEKVALRRERS